MKRTHKCTILAFLFFTSCSHVRKSDQLSTEVSDTIVFNNNTVVKKAPLLKEHKYIFLETTDESLIGEITKILYKNGLFFILDRDVAGRLFVFDRNGKFIYNIDSKGKGFGEYVYPNDFDVDAEGKVYIQDVQSRKIVVFKDQTAVEEIKIEVPFMEFSLSDRKNQIFLYKTFKNGSLDFIFNEYDYSNREFTDRQINADKVLNDLSIPFSSAFSLFHSKSSLNFQKRFTPDIYSYDFLAHKFKKRLFIDTDLFPKQEFIEKVRLNRELLKTEISHKFIRDITSIYETEDFLFFNMYLNTGTIKALVNKKDKKEYYYRDLAEGVLTNTVIYGTCENNFISAYANFTDKKGFDSTLDAMQMNVEEKSRLQNIASGDNPILVLLTYENKQ